MIGLASSPSDPSPAAERALIAAAASGDRRAFDVLDRRYRPRVWRFANARLRDPWEADDVTQEVFLEACRTLARYRGEGTLWSWLACITHRRICARYRGRTRWIPVDPHELAVLPAPAVGSAEARLDARRALVRCARVMETRLPQSQQRLLRLRYGESQPIRAIARTLRTTPGAVKVGLARTRATLRRWVPELAEPGP